MTDALATQFEAAFRRSGRRRRLVRVWIDRIALRIRVALSSLGWLHVVSWRGRLKR